jgi:hypothetical protein
MKENKELLKAELAALLSFDLDDINDVLEPLLEFDSEDDLLEYISALMGEVTERGKSFAKNLMRFQQGLDVIVAVDLDAINKKGTASGKPTGGTFHQHAASSLMIPTEVRRNAMDDAKKSAPPLQENKTLSSSSSSSVKKDRNETCNNEPTDGNTRNTTGKEHVPIHKQKDVGQKEPNKEQTLTALTFKQERKENVTDMDLIKSVANLKMSETKIRTKPRKETRPKKVPPTTKPSPKKGKAKFVCGCFGTVHKALTNCLHCGRISCEKEGYDYCPFCSFLIEQVKVVPIPGEEFNKAVMHKERLLQFDSENASRTVVYDDQADYFQNSLCTWLTEDERNDAFSKEERRRKDLHTIKKHVLNIQF